MYKLNLTKSYDFNPFAGVFEADFKNVIVPRFDTQSLIDELANSEVSLLEFLGRQGRGKSLHLNFLHQQMPGSALFLLEPSSNVEELLNHSSSLLFIDSIHHLNFLERIKLFKSRKRIVYTTHWSRKLEGALSARKIHSIRFKGIDAETLLEIINRRLKFASSDEDVVHLIDEEEVDLLLSKYKDNYRAIINHLFDQYQ